MQYRDFKMFRLLRGSPKVNHFAFTDDMIILCKSKIHTMQMVPYWRNMKELLVKMSIRRRVLYIYIKESLMVL